MLAKEVARSVAVPDGGVEEFGDARGLANTDMVGDEDAGHDVSTLLQDGAGRGRVSHQDPSAIDSAEAERSVLHEDITERGGCVEHGRVVEPRVTRIDTVHVVREVVRDINGDGLSPAEGDQLLMEVENVCVHADDPAVDVEGDSAIRDA